MFVNQSSACELGKIRISVLNEQRFKKPLQIIVTFFIVLSLFFLLNSLYNQSESLILRIDEKKAALASCQESSSKVISQEFTDFYKKKAMDRPVKNIEGQKVIERIRRQLHLSAFKLSAGADTVIDESLKLYTRKMTIKVSVDSEEKFYQLIDRLYQQLPGFFLVKKFVIIDKDDDLFEGKIECQWIRQKAS